MDISKARKYLKSRQSDMQHLTSFASMYNTAKARYSDIRLRIKTGRENSPGELSEKEVYALLDFAVLTYLKNHNALPADVSDLFVGKPSLESLKERAIGWLSV